ncbi:hypothetical protein [Serratia marcescens]|uniref:hypothetical protein n=1 Tax=Serratia marcescens TaxID=615 RepID=UPI001F14FE49|nr:hypothetical protein [Serratia marcescens]
MVQRYNPDYVMHAARFAPFARETEHGEFVKFSDYEALVSELASSRQINAQTLQVKLTMAETIKELTDRVNALAVENRELKKFGDKLNEMHNDLNGEGTGIQGRAEVVCQQAAIEAAMDEFDAITTPATNAALAAIQAQGVEKAATKLYGSGYVFEVLMRHATELREAK